MAKTPAWQRKAGKNPKGGLNARGRASARRQGMNLKAPVKSGDNPRRASFLARMGGMRGPERDAKGKPTRLLLSLRAWGASSKADAKRKAAAHGSSQLEGQEIVQGVPMVGGARSPACFEGGSYCHGARVDFRRFLRRSC